MNDIPVNAQGIPYVRSRRDTRREYLQDHDISVREKTRTIRRHMRWCYEDERHGGVWVSCCCGWDTRSTLDLDEHIRSLEENPEELERHYAICLMLDCP